MSNMSYCRFRNTLSDLEDCLDAYTTGEEIGKYEADAFSSMIETMQTFLQEVADRLGKEDPMEMVVNASELMEE